MEPRCVGCGTEMPRSSVACARCATPASGASLPTEVAASLSSVRVPDVCCCCLAPASVRSSERLVYWFGAEGGGLAQKYILVPLGWCRSCRFRRKLIVSLTVLAFIFCTLATIALSVLVLDWEFNEWFLFVMMIPGGLGAYLFHELAKLVLGRRRGHVRGCLAWDGGRADAPASDGRVCVAARFNNRAYAALWKAANAGE